MESECVFSKRPNSETAEEGSRLTKSLAVMSKGASTTWKTRRCHSTPQAVQFSSQQHDTSESASKKCNENTGSGTQSA